MKKTTGTPGFAGRSKPAALILLAAQAFASGPKVNAAETKEVEYEIVLDTLHRGYDGHFQFVHPRAGIVPRGASQPPEIVLTMSRQFMIGSDIYHELNEMRTVNMGRTWLGPIPRTDTLGRRAEPNGVSVVVSDFWPKWHAKTGKLLGIGHTVRYMQGKDGHEVIVRGSSKQTVYSIYDPDKAEWTRWTPLVMPGGDRFHAAGAGSTQRVDLPDGDILLPIYNTPKGSPDYTSLVLRCTFDGQVLQVQDVGDEIALKGGRGLAEPSLVNFQGRYLLTLRNDDAAYVTSSQDGLHFGPLQRWTWDDGSVLRSYNTQQHWVKHGDDALFLVYTRINAPNDFVYSKKAPGGTYLPDDPKKGASNDHVSRHRAPLFIGQVEPDRLTVMRSTERVLVPERGARVCNFGITEVSPDETWVTVAEWMQRERIPGQGPDSYIIPVDNARGADNSVYAARITWRTPSLAAAR